MNKIGSYVHNATQANYGASGMRAVLLRMNGVFFSARPSRRARALLYTPSAVAPLARAALNAPRMRLELRSSLPAQVHPTRTSATRFCSSGFRYSAVACRGSLRACCTPPVCRRCLRAMRWLIGYSTRAEGPRQGGGGGRKAREASRDERRQQPVPVLSVGGDQKYEEYDEHRQARLHRVLSEGNPMRSLVVGTEGRGRPGPSAV